MLQVLGGQVQHLAKAWEAQQKYSGMKRMTKAEINSMGPVFSPFDPSMRSVVGTLSMANPTKPTDVSAAGTGKRQTLNGNPGGAGSLTGVDGAASVLTLSNDYNGKVHCVRHHRHPLPLPLPPSRIHPPAGLDEPM